MGFRLARPPAPAACPRVWLPPSREAIYGRYTPFSAVPAFSAPLYCSKLHVGVSLPYSWALGGPRVLSPGALEVISDILSVAVSTNLYTPCVGFPTTAVQRRHTAVRRQTLEPRATEYTVLFRRFRRSCQVHSSTAGMYDKLYQSDM